MLKKLLCFMGGVMLISNLFSQSDKQDFRTLKEPFYLNRWIRQDIPLGKTINYKDSLMTLNDFKGKIIILSFWFTNCSVCIAQLPKEDSLQKLYNDQIQFILVCMDSEQKVNNLLAKWEPKSGIKLSIPMVVSDTVLRKVFRHRSDPHYAWIFPDGQIIAQTTQQFVTKENIDGLLKEWAKRKAHYESQQK